MSESTKNLGSTERTQFFTTTFSLAFLIVLAFSILVPINAMSSDQEVDRKVEQALLDEDWSRVGSLLDHVSPKTSSPVLRMIKGHADLAQNRNNQSLTLFIQLTVEDLQIWQSWSEELATRYETKSSPYYFLGDASARAANLDQAHAYFTKAIEANEANHLAWNARGVISALTGNYDSSLLDINKALSIKPYYYDAMNNIAVMRISQGQGRKGAIRRFGKVIDANPNFALAYHGLGCLELLTTQKPIPENNNNLTIALDLIPEAHELLLENEARFLDAYLDKQAWNQADNLVSAGTMIKKSYEYNRARLEGALKQVDVANELVTKRKGNIFLEGPAKQRLRQAEKRVVALSSPNIMQNKHWRKMTAESPHTVTRARNIVGNYEKHIGTLENQAKIGRSSMDNQSRALDTSKWAVTGYGIAAKDIKTAPAVFALDTTKRVTDYNRRGYDTSAQLAGNLKQNVTNIKNSIPIVQYSNSQSIRSHKAPEIPMPSRNLSKGIPGMRSTFNLPGGGPGGQHGGATTDKTAVTWDDDDWPFVPIFGLLYFATDQTVVVSGS